MPTWASIKVFISLVKKANILELLNGNQSYDEPIDAIQKPNLNKST
jgi:hypothetical protein